MMTILFDLLDFVYIFTYNVMKVIVSQAKILYSFKVMHEYFTGNRPDRARSRDL